MALAPWVCACSHTIAQSFSIPALEIACAFLKTIALLAFNNLYCTYTTDRTHADDPDKRWKALLPRLVQSLWQLPCGFVDAGLKVLAAKPAGPKVYRCFTSALQWSYKSSHMRPPLRVFERTKGYCWLCPCNYWGLVAAAVLHSQQTKSFVDFPGSNQWHGKLFLPCA